MTVPTVAPAHDDPRRVAIRALIATHPRLTPSQRDAVRTALRTARTLRRSA